MISCDSLIHLHLVLLKTLRVIVSDQSEIFFLGLCRCSLAVFPAGPPPKPRGALFPLVKRGAPKQRVRGASCGKSNNASVPFFHVHSLLLLPCSGLSTDNAQRDFTFEGDSGSTSSH